MGLDFHGLITSDVALFSTCGPLENRVLKTRFIIQKNFKNLPSLKHSLTSPDRIRSERESDQREGDQIRERERVRLERERERSRDLGCATQAVRPGSRDPGALAQPRSRTSVAQPRCATFLLLRFFFFSFWLWFPFLMVLLLYMGFKLSL